MFLLWMLILACFEPDLKNKSSIMISDSEIWFSSPRDMPNSFKPLRNLIVSSPLAPISHSLIADDCGVTGPSLVAQMVRIFL